MPADTQSTDMLWQNAQSDHIGSKHQVLNDKGPDVLCRSSDMHWVLSLYCHNQNSAHCYY